MNHNTAKERNAPSPSRKQEIDLLELARTAWSARRLIFKLGAIGAVVGVVIAAGTPQVYTASTLVANEGTRKRTSGSISALASVAGNANSAIATERDALYPSLYPSIVKSTPFLLGLFEVEVREQKDSAPITLAQYLKEHQKKSWWSVIASAPSKLLRWSTSFAASSSPKPRAVTTASNHQTTPLLLTRDEAAMARSIASCISVIVDKKKKTMTIDVTMQNPQIAALVADTVQMRLMAFMTEYRTGKARRILEYSEKMCQEAQANYYAAQSSYTRYADANQNLALLTSRAELARLRGEMELASKTYNRLEVEVKAAEARVNMVTPVYTVIQPPSVPLAPSKPNVLFIIIGCIFLACIGGMAWVLFVRDFIQEMRNKECCPQADLCE